MTLQSFPMTSPPAIVPRARQVSRWIELRTKRTEPSIRATFTSLGWKLRAVMAS